MTAPLLVRLGARDRALLQRCAITPTARPASRAVWAAVTHLGSTWSTVAAAAVPGVGCCALRRASRLALATLVVSHLLVQLLKRTAGRDRPSSLSGGMALVREPDRYSFPSGHAAAAMAIALAYSAVFPVWAPVLLLLAFVVGFSRVRLAVHYPSDVVAGQLIAAGTLGILLAG
jgi:undecaprenyl-diphosphatase